MLGFKKIVGQECWGVNKILGHKFGGFKQIL